MWDCGRCSTSDTGRANTDRPRVTVSCPTREPVSFSCPTGAGAPLGVADRGLGGRLLPAAVGLERRLARGSGDTTERGVAISGTDVGGMDHEEVAVVVDDLAEGFGTSRSRSSRRPARSRRRRRNWVSPSTLRQRSTPPSKKRTMGSSCFARSGGFASFFLEQPSRGRVRGLARSSRALALAAEPLAVETAPVAPKLAVDGEEMVVVPGVPGEGIDAEALAAALPEASGRSDRPIRVEVGWAEVLRRSPTTRPRRCWRKWIRPTAASCPPRCAGSPSICLVTSSPWRGVAGTAAASWYSSSTRPSALEVLEEFVAERTNIASQGGRFEVVSGEVQIVLPEESEVCCDPVAVAAVEEALLATDPPTEPIDLPLRDADDEQARAELEELGINTLVASFTTNHACCQNRVENIHRIADITRGVVIRPGATFSVNNYVGRRTEENGFVSDGVIQDGVFEKEVGGGISQYATTLFNSAFRAGLEFGEYQSHSLYISRYPYGVEATLSFPHPEISRSSTRRHTASCSGPATRARRSR